MSDKEQILSLLNRYSIAVDSGDLEGFVALYGGSNVAPTCADKM